MRPCFSFHFFFYCFFIVSMFSFCLFMFYDYVQHFVSTVVVLEVLWVEFEFTVVIVFNPVMISSLQCVLAEQKRDNLNITTPKLINPTVVVRVRPTCLCFCGSAEMKNKNEKKKRKFCSLFTCCHGDLLYLCYFFKKNSNPHTQREKYSGSMLPQFYNFYHFYF